VTERELDRRVPKRLAIIRTVEAGDNVAPTCRRYGISRQTFYTWLRRYQELGPFRL